MAVRVGKEKGNPSAEIPFAAHEDPFVRYEDVVEDHNGIGDAVFAEGRRAGVIFLPMPDRAGDQVYPFPVRRNGKGHGKGTVVFHKGTGGKDEHFVGVGHLGNGHFYAGDDDPVFSLFDDMDVSVGVGLLAGPLQAVSLAVRLGTAAVPVVSLILPQIGQESLVIASSLGLVHLLGADGQRIDGIVAHATVDAAANASCRQADHLLLLHEVVGILRQVGEPVDLFTDERGLDGHQALPF